MVYFLLHSVDSRTKIITGMVGGGLSQRVLATPTAALCRRGSMGERGPRCGQWGPPTCWVGNSCSALSSTARTDLLTEWKLLMSDGGEPRSIHTQPHAWQWWCPLYTHTTTRLTVVMPTLYTHNHTPDSGDAHSIHTQPHAWQWWCPLYTHTTTTNAALMLGIKWLW